MLTQGPSHEESGQAGLEPTTESFEAGLAGEEVDREPTIADIKV